MAKLLKLPLSKVRVYAPDPGGGFGGKQHAKYEPAVAFAAFKVGQPVRLVLTLEESFKQCDVQAVKLTFALVFKKMGPLYFKISQQIIS